MKYAFLIITLLVALPMQAGKKGHQLRGKNHTSELRNSRRSQAKRVWHDKSTDQTSAFLDLSRTSPVTKALLFAVVATTLLQPALAAQCTFERVEQNGRPLIQAQCSDGFGCKVIKDPIPTISCARQCNFWDEDCSSDLRSVTLACPAGRPCQLSSHGLNCVEKGSESLATLILGDSYFVCSDEHAYLPIDSTTSIEIK